MELGSYLFVYGSLLKDQDNAMACFLQEHSTFINEGFFNGRLYQVSWFPGAVLSDQKSDRVYGHIFQLNDDRVVFPVLDDYEGIGESYEEPQLFKKVLVSVRLKNGQNLNCWTYLYNRSVDELQQITTGNYLEYTK